MPITAGSSMDRGPPHSFQRKHEPQISPQPPAAAQNRDLNTTRSLSLSNDDRKEVNLMGGRASREELAGVEGGKLLSVYIL